jgi:tRNA(Ile)-lysidine synthase
MSDPAQSERPLEVARESGLLHAGEPVLILISGGADSLCLLDVALRIGADASALHLNYGLRPEAAYDERLCRATCERLGVPLVVERVELAAATAPGNLQAEARERRYALAERHAAADYAAAHTASDQAETIVYRLATSPGRRALLGMEPRRGRLVRPLLSATAEETRGYCRARELEWAEDTSNLDPRFARSRLRGEVMPVLRGLNPGAELTIAETARLLRDEAEVLDGAVEDAVDRLGATAVPLAELREEPIGLARLVLRRLAEAASAGAASISRADADRILGLARSGGSASLDVGSGLRAVVEYGVLRFATAPDAASPEPATLPIPGSVRFGEWEVEARLGAGGEAVVSAAALGRRATVRAWRPGDRMRPLGLGGTKSLQDIFTDRKVPRALRARLPVVESGGEIVWVAGVAASEAFLPRDGETVALSARSLG